MSVLFARLWIALFVVVGVIKALCNCALSRPGVAPLPRWTKGVAPLGTVFHSCLPHDMKMCFLISFHRMVVFCCSNW